MADAFCDSHTPSLPVSTFSLALHPLAPARERLIHDVDDHELAALVRLRLHLDQLHGWWVLGGVLLALASVVAVGVACNSRLVLGAYAAAVASATVGVGLFATWLQVSTFRRRAHEIGLSGAEADRLFVAAADADHWLGVMQHCGLPVTASEIAAFVRKPR